MYVIATATSIPASSSSATILSGGSIHPNAGASSTWVWKSMIVTRQPPQSPRSASCHTVGARKVRSKPPPFHVEIRRGHTLNGTRANPNVDSAYAMPSGPR